MTKRIQLDFDIGLEELNPLAAGEAICDPDDTYLNFRSRFGSTIIHYVRRGKGTFCCKGEVYPVHAGQAFIIFAGDVVSFYPDQDDPWEYAWITFGGKLSYHFSVLPPVFTMPEGGFAHIRDVKNTPNSFPYLVVSDLFYLYAKLIEPQVHKLDYISSIINHIQQHYMEQISVNNYAKQFNMDRAYLSKQFKKKMGISIRSYITDLRLFHAKRLIYDGFNCKEASMQCGFNNTANFFKMFKKKFGSTPMDWLDQVSKQPLPPDLTPPTLKKR